MKIKSVCIRNFRMLQNMNIDLQDELSLVIGRNNSGKTSFFSVLQKFLSEGGKNFLFEDFSIPLQQELILLEKSNYTADKYQNKKINLKLYIEYDKDENIAEASKLILDLDDSKYFLAISFEYILTFEKYRKLLDDYMKYKKAGVKRSFQHYLSKNMKNYFQTKIYALEYDNENYFKEIGMDVINSILSIEFIGAKRDVENKQGKSKSLSSLAERYYQANTSKDIIHPELDKELQRTDESLTGTYKDIFSPIINEIKEMSYNPQEAEISIHSSLSEKSIFQENTLVKYQHDDTLLPEDYNGLGYLNLFSIVFDIRIKLDSLSKKNDREVKSTPINLLFIEEPEAHTHPQMQYIFIRNIKRILEKHCTSNNLNLQTIITTHSPHIVSQCNFEDIKYFYKETSNSVNSRSLSCLHSDMPSFEFPIENENEIPSETETTATRDKNYRFLKQYITLHRAELFFAEKAILIEGDTERVLLSAMMKKFDDENIDKQTEHYQPLLSQNISVVEVGAYSHVFATFLRFLGIKTLIITDIDLAKLGANGHLTKANEKDATTTTNASIKYFLNEKDIKKILSFSNRPIMVEFDDTTKQWKLSEEGQLAISFQKNEYGYQARSFEDAFLSRNLNFVVENKNNFLSLKNRKMLVNSATDYDVLADDCIDKKTTFALDVILYDGINGKEWVTPEYIKEGLEWLNQ